MHEAGATRAESLAALGRENDVVFICVTSAEDVAAVVTGPDGLLYAVIQNPTGPGTGLDLSDPAPGAVVRIDPIVWKQEPFRRPQ